MGSNYSDRVDNGAPPHSSAKPLRVLVVHNAYQQRGGEDAVVESEVDLLREHNHPVMIYRRDNAEINSYSKSRLATETIWSNRTMRDIQTIASTFAPEVIHVHNTFPLVSPSIYWSAARLDVPAVHTLHNFRLLCPQAMFLRQGMICEDCLGHAPWRGILHRCYHKSFTQSAIVAAMLTAHKCTDTWSHKVTRFIALTEFSRTKFIAGGVPAGRIVVKPNFVRMPRSRPGRRSAGLFVGRLSSEKGISVLLKALSKLPRVQFRVAGTGPDAHLLTRNRDISDLGELSADAVASAMCESSYLVMPSICYETFGRVVIEAYACGLPVIASRLGAMAELIEEGRTGLLFAPGDADDLARAIAWAEAHPTEMRAMGDYAREVYEKSYTPDVNYRQLMAIYHDAIDEVARERG